MRKLLVLGLTLGWAQRLVCGTDLYMQELERRHPEIVRTREELEEAIYHWTQTYLASARTENTCPESDYIIPVVVHIIHSGNGQPDSLPISRVLRQIEQLFDDYRKRPYSKGYSSGVDTRIEFSLATKDTAGNPHPGVTYTHYTAAGLSQPRVDISNGDDITVKTNVGWPRNKYLNIWVVKELCSGSMGCGILGFAPFPGSPSVERGIMVISDYFGNVGGGQTTTHEAGHYLNLYHTFQGGCTGLSNSNCGTQGDRVCDTPPTSSANYQNARRQNTCNENITVLNGNAPDQVRNYMDYLDDPSLDIFTAGQTARMVAALQSASDLNQLRQTANLQATGSGPWGRIKANFAMEGCEQPPCVVCPGQSIKLISYSMGKPHIFQWEIRQGSTVIASSTTGPCATMNAPATPGTYSVRLQVQNQAGSADTTYNNFLIVRDPNAVAAYPFSEGFESTTFPPTGWTRINPDFATGNSNLTWERYSSPGRGSFGASNAMVRIRNHRYFNASQRDYLITPLINIPATANDPAIIFDVYYRAVEWGNIANNMLLYADTLAVYISNDCGASWTLLYEEAGNDLDVTGSAIQQTGSYPTEVIPPSGPNTAWVRKQVPIPAAYKGTNVLIRFENRTGMGNTLYLDSIQVRDNNTTTLPQPLTTITFSPNPVRDGVGYLHIRPALNEPMSYTIRTVTGQVLREEQLPTGETTHRLSFANLPAGIYLLEVRSGAVLRYLQRVVVAD